MQAIQANLLTFIRNAHQFVIPDYQRHYEWTESECIQLWRDIERAGGDDKVITHFIGMIMYVESGTALVAQPVPLLVIDGQQRLTSSTLLIAALLRFIENNNKEEMLNGNLNSQILKSMLINTFYSDHRKYKLILTARDRDTLLAIINNTPLPNQVSKKVKENFDLFERLISDSNQQGNLETICSGLAKLMIVQAALNRNEDDPQLIFESMNSNGLALSQADLIRNYILMNLDNEDQRNLYNNYWIHIENLFEVDYINNFDIFIRYYLTAKTGSIPNVRQVYSYFKSYAPRNGLDVNVLVADIHKYANYYAKLALRQENNNELRRVFQDFRELKVDVAYPFLLDVYCDYDNDRLNLTEFIQIIRLVESYVFRRNICNLPSQSINRIFATMSRRINRDSYLESVKAIFLLLPPRQRFPNDEEFQREIKTRNIYENRNRNYCLRRLENHGRNNALITIEDYTIEHIMPQNETLSTDWQNELGPEWGRVQQDWLHTLGNLTLTVYNSQYSDKPFRYKQLEVQNNDGYDIGFKVSPLRLYQFQFDFTTENEQTNCRYSLVDVPVWNESTIKARADCLAVEALRVWPAPVLTTEQLDMYRR